MLKEFILCALFIIAHPIFAQTDSTYHKKVVLNEVVVSVNKTEEKKLTVAQQVQVITAEDIKDRNPQTTADVISNTGLVLVQKSQQGGGSPVLRGLEASRVVLLIDGVRMNNLIYRAGHLQNIITIDNAILDRAEILFGPSSVMYGSDALGGVVHFITKNPLLAYGEQKIRIKTNAYTRYSTVNNEMTGHVDFNLGFKKFASLTSITYSDFDDLRQGNIRSGYNLHFGRRHNYAERINGKDSLFLNDDSNIQKFSGYHQYDIMQKLLYAPNEYVKHILNVQLSNTSNIPRYDRLTDTKGAGLRFAEWYYGPQKRNMLAYHFNFKNDSAFLQQFNVTANMQQVQESRYTRDFGKPYLDGRIEDVNVFGLTADAFKKIKNNEFHAGIDVQYNTLISTATRKDIVQDTVGKLDTRYPDGDNSMNTNSLYLSHTYKIGDKFAINEGIRFSMIELQATSIDTSFYTFPFSTIDQTNNALCGNIGIVFNPVQKWRFNLSLSNGFRAPNIDDMGKTFLPANDNTLIFPNANLKPEQTYNADLGITHYFNDDIRWEGVMYYTLFNNAIVVDKLPYNGRDSISYQGNNYLILSAQNKREAYIYGGSSSFTADFTNYFSFNTVISYTCGRIKTDTVDIPLDHIPPVTGKTSFYFHHKKWESEFFINYNGWKRISDYLLNGEDNEKYATPAGMPAWYTLNLRMSYKFTKQFMVQAGLDNILDANYRVFASGISAPGRNLYITLRASL